MRNTEGEKQNGVQQVSVSSVLDDCDVEYDVEVKPSGTYYESFDENIANISRTVQVSRNVLFTEKTIQTLLKHGRLTNREKFFWKFSNWVGNMPFARCAVAAGVFLVAINVLAAFYPVVAIVLAGSLCIGFGFLCHSAESNVTNVKKRIRKECSETRKIELPLPWSTEGLYNFITALKNDELTADEKKQIFEMLEDYPSEVDEQILKLRKTKEGLPQNNREAEMVFHEVNAALKKLFALREAPKNKRVFNKVLEIFNIAMKRKGTKELGPAMANLSDVSEFLNDATKDTEVAEVISALNKVTVPAGTDEETLDELFVKQHLDEHSQRKQQYYS